MTQPTRYFEDVELGVKTELGFWTFTEDDIVRFAKAYDPQPFHIDPAVAKASHFGGLVASGWYTAAIWMKLVIAYRDRIAAAHPEFKPPPGHAAGVSPGFLDLKWLKPVRPGDTLRYATTPVERIDLKSRPELGLIRAFNTVHNEAGELVMSFKGQGFYPRRPK
jgi:acyl dehydratase